MVRANVHRRLTLRTSIEVDTTHAQPRAIAVLFDGGQPFWRLEFVGSSSTRSNMAVGGIAESFQHVSRSSD